MFFYDEPYAEPECFYCNEKAENLDTVKEWMDGLLKQLYGHEPYDALMIENCLDEMAHAVGLKLPKGDLQILPKQKRPTTLTEEILEQWKSLNSKYLKSLSA